MTYYYLLSKSIAICFKFKKKNFSNIQNQYSNKITIFLKETFIITTAKKHNSQLLSHLMNKMAKICLFFSKNKKINCGSAFSKRKKNYKQNKMSTTIFKSS